MTRQEQGNEIKSEVLRDFGAYEHVLGVAVGRDAEVTVLLDQDDEETRSAIRLWARRHSTDIAVRVVGNIVAN